MRQIGGENDDPLKRIQQEINEVKQRELELRNQLRYDSLPKQKSQKQESPGDPRQNQNSDDSGVSTTSSSPVNGTSANRALDLDSSATAPPASAHHFVDHSKQKQQPAPRTLVPVSATAAFVGTKKKLPPSNPTYVRSTSAAAFVFAPRNPKPALPVEYYLPPQPVKSKASTAAPKKNQRNETMLTRTVSTPQLFQSFQPKASPTRSFMQRFIATRGKLSSSAVAAKTPVIDNGPVLNAGSISISPTAQIAPPLRDADGKPLRKGFVPVEEKIQKELREMRHREVELKIQRQKSQYDSNNNLDDESEPFNSLDFEEENSFKLRAAKSISELSDYSPSSSPQFDSPYNQRYKDQQASYGPRPKLRPALSLAQLCDLDPSEELVSSNRLIAQFECLIQKKRTVA